jgi:hypothetical protein
MHHEKHFNRSTLKRDPTSTVPCAATKYKRVEKY